MGVWGTWTSNQATWDQVLSISSELDREITSLPCTSLAQGSTEIILLRTKDVSVVKTNAFEARN